MFLNLGIICSLVALTLSADINSSCNTPQNYPGVCIPLPSCTQLNALMQQPRPLPSTTVQLLRRSQCGYLHPNPLVCCRINQPVSSTTAAPTSTTTSTGPTDVPTPRDVSQHRNIGLINSEFCGQGSELKIVNGETTGIYEFPWMTLLNYRSTTGNRTTESFRCGGSLINPKHILTAAHCISNTQRLRLINVRVGDHNITTEEDCEVVEGVRYCAPHYQNIDIESFVRHPGYNAKTYIHDIALIRLARPADTTKENVRPVCLPVGLSEQTRNLDGRKLVVAGWGFTEERISSTALLKVSLPVMPVTQCHNVFSREFGFNINGNQLCAGGTNLRQDSCRGDSGGPLMSFSTVNSAASAVQYGIVSYGHRDCGTAGVPGVYTRVGHYMDWILNNIRP